MGIRSDFTDTVTIMRDAVQAKAAVAALPTEEKNALLEEMAEELLRQSEHILQENAADIHAAQGKISEVMLDRLLLTQDRIRGMADGIRAVAGLPDPTGRILKDYTAASGIHVRRIAVPFGVVAIIYESRPNVTSDAAALCIKSGNVSLLRSGKEAFRTSAAIVDAMRTALIHRGLPAAAVSIVEDTSRESAAELMRARNFVDLLIPRGGPGLIRACVENSTVPCIETGTGICSVYVDESADQEAALRIIENAKTSRPSVCNAAETCLVHEKIAAEFLPKLKVRLTEERVRDGKVPVELRLCEKARAVIDGKPAAPEDFDTEFLDYILAVKVVADVREAVAHIAEHSTHHSESILTQDEAAAEYFTENADSAAVYVNASTRFTDGGEFGLGCEMGISTQKLHARGPMGLEELCTYKYVIRGEGQIR